MSEARSDAVETRREQLADELTAFEDRFEYDVEATLRRAAELERTADDLAEPALKVRARLVTAAMWRRTGDLAAAARACWEAHAWAADHGDQLLLCRSHVQLSGVYDTLGDGAAALEHAACAVGFSDGAPSRARAYCLMRLGDTLALNGTFEPARERYHQAERVAVAGGDTDLQIAILNNVAYADQLAGDIEHAWATIGRIRQLATASGEVLKPSTLDTIARIEIATGRYADAERTARLGIDRHDPRFGTQDAGSLAECLLTLGVAQRHQGDSEVAQASLDACRTVCDRSDLAAVRVRATEEQAELYAAAGDLGRAFETHKEFFAAYQALQSGQRQAQARTQQVMLQVAEARQEAERFRQQALRDPLTGLPNRRFVEEQLPAMLARVADTGSPLTVAILDIDHFKQINDTCSHNVGDHVLTAFAALLSSTVPSTDAAGGAADAAGFAARLGGEEFLLLITDVAAAEAVRRIERLRRAVAAHPWHTLTGAVPVTVSIGVTVAQPDSTRSSLFARADATLYTAKRSGRNRVCIDPGVSLAERRARRGDPGAA